jgi:lipoate-protein ligase A
MLTITDYNLPDTKLLEKGTDGFLIWIPDKTYIVLGASNKAEDSLFTENVKQDNVTVMKRHSGGQAVMLTPNNLIISVVFVAKEAMKPKDIFFNINSLIVSALERAGINDLSLKGISDIAISGKKISGSAIYRNKDKLLYHAVLNLGEPASTFERYLKHPVKEPDYRKGRNHTDFVTSLKDNGYSGSYDELAGILSAMFTKKLTSNMVSSRTDLISC